MWQKKKIVGELIFSRGQFFGIFNIYVRNSY